jgi:energy-coupling factor transporter ATP-binding protein EcfA2
MIRLDRVSKSYRTRAGRHTVLDDVGATFEAGHNFGILGLNGAGKSTLIRLLAGSEMPDRGTIRRSARVSFPLGFGVNLGSAKKKVEIISILYSTRLSPYGKYTEWPFPDAGALFGTWLIRPPSAANRQRLSGAGFRPCPTRGSVTRSHVSDSAALDGPRSVTPAGTGAVTPGNTVDSEANAPACLSDAGFVAPRAKSGGMISTSSSPRSVGFSRRSSAISSSAAWICSSSSSVYFDGSKRRLGLGSSAGS